MKINFSSTLFVEYRPLHVCFFANLIVKSVSYLKLVKSLNVIPNLINLTMCCIDTQQKKVKYPVQYGRFFTGKSTIATILIYILL